MGRHRLAVSTILRREIRRLNADREAITRRLGILERALAKLEALEEQEEQEGLEARKEGEA